MLRLRKDSCLSKGTLVATMVVVVIDGQIGLDLALRFSVFASMLAIPFYLILKEPRRSR